MTVLVTTISAATVYPDRVRLTRNGSIKLGVGSHSLALSQLPLTIDPDSIRASVYGSTKARLLGIEIRRTYYTDQPTEAVRKLEERIEKKQDELTLMDTRLELIKQNRVTLDKLAGQVTTYATAIAAGELSVEQQLDYFGKLRKKSESLDEEALTIQAHQRNTKRELEKLTRELEQIENAIPRERYTAFVNLDVEEESKLTIEVSYVVSEAGWKPLYDLRLLEKNGTQVLEVAYLADVKQNTGEAWEDISMTLSTARPAVTSTLPELDPWYIHPPEPIYPPVPLAMAAAAAPSSDANAKFNFQAPLRHMELRQERSEEVTAEVSTAGASVSYLIPVQVTIPPDGSPHKVTIARFMLTPVLDYVCTPKLVQAVYRRAKVENDSPYTLLPGAANILIIDEYVGTTQLKLTVTGGEIELYLGSDNRLKVERELKRRDVDKKMIGGKRNQAFAYEIRLESTLPEDAPLTIYDQIPVSRNEDIKVKLESADPKPTEQTELNLLIWEMVLGPKEKRALRFDFNVESPQAMKVIGLL